MKSKEQSLFFESYSFRMNENIRMITKAINSIDEADVWKKPNASLNSIANLLLHLCGNITQYGIASLGNQKDTRNRDEEFQTKQGYTKSQLLEKLTNTVQDALQIASQTPTLEWEKYRNVQGFNLSGYGVALHVVEHFSYHTGQIVFWVKLLTNSDLQLYAGINLNQKNE